MRDFKRVHRRKPFEKEEKSFLESLVSSFSFTLSAIRGSKVYLSRLRDEYLKNKKKKKKSKEEEEEKKKKKKKKEKLPKLEKEKYFPLLG